MVRKALSVRQPWAWCIVNKYKPVENRSRNIKYRGFLLVHASLKYDYEGDKWIRANMPHVPLPPAEELKRGGIVGEVVVEAVVHESDTRLLKSMFGGWALQWFFGPYGYVLTNAKKLPFRPYKGMLGLFNVEE